ncbi:hypothetical protein NE865_08942 [Phthorimaea operculella]|nr:hypothetical protein NE865_08942 [Phthorimaea operculella]
MEFFGISSYGPQNYFKDILREGYREPMSKEEVGPIMKHVRETSACNHVQRPEKKGINVKVVEDYNGFAYGSNLRFQKMQRKAIFHPPGPADMYRLPPTTSNDIGWWVCDPELISEDWYKPRKFYPQAMSPRTKIFDIVKRNNKYAEFF